MYLATPIATLEIKSAERLLLYMAILWNGESVIRNICNRTNSNVHTICFVITVNDPFSITPLFSRLMSTFRCILASIQSIAIAFLNGQRDGSGDERRRACMDYMLLTSDESPTNL